MTKTKQSKTVQVILLIFGIVFFCGGVYFLINGIHNYARQFHQRDWQETTATVIRVDERIESNQDHSHFTVYDIYFQYEANGQLYTYSTYRNNAPKNYGDTITVKYDPHSPGNATHYLEPEPGLAWGGLFGFAVFGLIGLRIIRSALPAKKPRSSGHRK